MYYFIIITIIVLLDQISKIWIKTNLEYHHSIQILGDFIRFTYVENSGLAFGITIGKFSFIVIILSILIIIYIIKEMMHNKHHNSNLGLSMILGGAIGNLIDRVLMHLPNFNYNGVVDFIDIGSLNYRWYTFNVADSFVCIGMGLYLILTKLSSNR